MSIQIIQQKISIERIKELASEIYGDMIKGVVDVNQKIMALGGELHADAEEILLKNGSKQDDLWGFNIYPDKSKDDRLEYTSFINIRPRQGNRSIEIQDQKLKDQMKKIIQSLIDE